MGADNMKAILVLTIFFSGSLGQIGVCQPPGPAECASDTDVRCDMGSYAGCWAGDYCLPEGSVCPPPCHSPAPSNCTNGEVLCDVGTNAGCWTGDYCMPEGSFCPPPCHSPVPSQCMEGEVVCDMGSNAGCWSGDYCMPEGSFCPPPCHSP